jgi:two-component system sensor histidine kinase/response regulator
MKITQDALVLVVEDSADLNTAICDILASYGYQVQGALNGFEALEHLRARKPDVILCDIMMPGMDGYTLLRHTRADENLRTLPFIFLTALSSSAEQRRAKEIGIDDFLTKPVDSSDLVAAIENALHRHRLMEEDTQRRLDDLRNRIVGLLQHEFRTPLTLVLGYAELIANTTPTNLQWDELRLSAAAILEGGSRLRTLIESFLLLAALQSRTLHPGELECLSASRLWEEVVSEFAAADKAENPSFELLPTQPEAYVTGDEYLIKESLRRLLEGGLHSRRSARDRIQLSVVTLAPYVGLRIEGGGSPFYQPTATELLHPNGHNGQEELMGQGTGLSLTLVKQIAQMHGGQLQVENKGGQTGAVTLWLPAAAPAPTN